MATGQTQYNSSLNPTAIYEAALMYLRAENVMAGMVSTFNDRQGLIPRTGSRWGELNYREIGVTDDVTPETYTRSALGTLTPKIYANQVFISDEDQKTDLEDLQAAAAMELGAGAAQHMEENLLTLFDDLTGGTIGAAGSTISWGYFWAMRSRLEVQTKVRRPKFFVCHTYQWHQLAKTAGSAGIDLITPRDVDQSIVSAFSLRQVDDVIIYPTPNISIDSASDAYCGMFDMEALALDLRTGFNLRPQRDESRGGGGVELNASMTYAFGVWDASKGIQGIFDATAPTS